MAVDSFKFLPRLIATFYQMTEREPAYPIPWTPLRKPLSACKFGLVTSAGLYCQETQPPFDVAREHQEPTWGDPTYRAIPSSVRQEDVAISHLHLNSDDMAQDMNIVLPIHRFQELAAAGEIGALAATHYSFMGFQGFPPDATLWQSTYGPEVAAKFKAEGVDCVLLTPT
ncbi:MAG: glycine/sarcosine/betaine reductase selenoprotein B family protein [Chloroflexota bacterium]